MGRQTSEKKLAEIMTLCSDVLFQQMFYLCNLCIYE